MVNVVTSVSDNAVKGFSVIKCVDANEYKLDDKGHKGR